MGSRDRKSREVSPEEAFTIARIASEPATLVTLASYAGRNFETELAVPNALLTRGAEGTLGHRRRFSSEQGSVSGREADRDFVRLESDWVQGSQAK